VDRKFHTWGALRTFLLIAGFLLVPLLVHAGGDKVHEVGIKKYKFTPQEITIQAGETVRWVNNEIRQFHSVWFEESGEEEPVEFFPDETYERTFVKPGTFRYRCGPHEEMTGVIHVK